MTLLVRALAALAAGAALNLAFAPFGLWPVGVLAPALLFALIRGLPPRRAGVTGAAGSIPSASTNLVGTSVAAPPIVPVTSAPL